jgi:hypothetical protein
VEAEKVSVFRFRHSPVGTGCGSTPKPLHFATQSQITNGRKRPLCDSRDGTLHAGKLPFIRDGARFTRRVAGVGMSRLGEGHKTGTSYACPCPQHLPTGHPVCSQTHVTKTSPPSRNQLVRRSKLERRVNPLMHWWPRYSVLLVSLMGYGQKWYPGQLRTSLLGMSFLDRLESGEVRRDQLMMRGKP